MKNWSDFSKSPFKWRITLSSRTDTFFLLPFNTSTNIPVNFIEKFLVHLKILDVIHQFPYSFGFRFSFHELFLHLNRSGSQKVISKIKVFFNRLLNPLIFMKNIFEIWMWIETFHFSLIFKSLQLNVIQWWNFRTIFPSQFIFINLHNKQDFNYICDCLFFGFFKSSENDFTGLIYNLKRI